MNQSPANVTLFVKAGKDGKSLGACPQSQRVLMLAELKVAAMVLPRFETIPVNVARPPDTFRLLGLRLRVPALYLGIGEDPVDVADDIVSLLESRFPGGILQQNQEDPEAEVATRDFFSRFCFYVRDVSKDVSHLETELRRIDCYLRNASSHNNSMFLCGPTLSFLDCEVLPKLHQVRVAAAGIKGLILRNKVYTKIVSKETQVFCRISANANGSPNILLVAVSRSSHSI